tara:strand:- start:293 stop:925 length:633 start_codon:yes stop_codon:yes gene_type:complete
MSIISPTFIRPNINNKSDVIELFEEIKQIYNYYDVSSKVVEIIEGKNVGCLGLIRSYNDFSSLASVMPKLRENKRFQELNLKIFEKQFGETTTNGQIWLTVFGSRNWKSNPVSMVRQYSVSRNQLPDMLSILSEIQNIMDKKKVNVLGLIPPLGEGLSALHIPYQFESLDHWGEVLDYIKNSEEMNSLIGQKNKFGSLETGHLMIPLDGL